MFVHQTALIEQLIQVNRKLDARVAMMEAKVYNKQQQTHTTTHKTSDYTFNEPASNMKDVWFAYCSFEGFTLDEKSPQYRDNVLAFGAAAEKELLVFLATHNVRAQGAQDVLKALRQLRKTGHLNNHIRHYKQLQSAGRIVDHAPLHTTNILTLAPSPQIHVTYLDL
ncbi:Hypothetical protein PHPALM_17671 [Phytophthora palmivora]|uniref:Uncharacterized protein n=1 Tax=Phytophthora palmivora TaxID=4796 RepID=A0A2P4XLM5_9STRA|nr:Hypothetical protein PHPALM_17671 [Phytophthora palmivora]